MRGLIVDREVDVYLVEAFKELTISNVNLHSRN